MGASAKYQRFNCYWIVSASCRLRTCWFRLLSSESRKRWLFSQLHMNRSCAATSADHFKKGNHRIHPVRDPEDRPPQLLQTVSTKCWADCNRCAHWSNQKYQTQQAPNPCIWTPQSAAFRHESPPSSNGAPRQKKISSDAGCKITSSQWTRAACSDWRRWVPT